MRHTFHVNLPTKTSQLLESITDESRYFFVSMCLQDYFTREFLRSTGLPKKEKEELAQSFKKPKMIVEILKFIEEKKRVSPNRLKAEKHVVFTGSKPARDDVHYATNACIMFRLLKLVPMEYEFMGTLKRHNYLQMTAFGRQFKYFPSYRAQFCKKILEDNPIIC